MRFEARHSYFKRLVNQLGNYINIPYTLATRHQQLQCYYHLDKSNIGGIELNVGAGEQVGPDQIPGLSSSAVVEVERFYRYVL